MAEGEAFWATIAATAARYREAAPEGTTIVVEIETFDGERFLPLGVQRYPPWIIFETGDPEDVATREVYFVLEQDIRRVRMRRERGDKTLGFTVGQVIPDVDE
jgi:hypothetical protein